MDTDGSAFETKGTFLGVAVHRMLTSTYFRVFPFLPKLVEIETILSIICDKTRLFLLGTHTVQCPVPKDGQQWALKEECKKKL